MSEPQDKKERFKEETASSSDELEEVENFEPCPFGRIRSNKLLTASDEDNMTVIPKRHIVDAFTGWDTRVITGVVAQTVALSTTSSKQGNSSNVATKNGVKSNNGARRQARPMTVVGSVRPPPPIYRAPTAEYTFHHYSDRKAFMKQYRQEHTAGQAGRTDHEDLKLRHDAGSVVRAQGMRTARLRQEMTGDLKQLKECTDIVERLRLLAILRRKASSAPPYRSTRSSSSSSAPVTPPESGSAQVSASHHSRTESPRIATPIDKTDAADALNNSQDAPSIMANSAKQIGTEGLESILQQNLLAKEESEVDDVQTTTRTKSNPLGNMSNKQLSINLSPVRDAISQSNGNQTVRFPEPMSLQKQLQLGYRHHMDLSTPHSTFQSAQALVRTPRDGNFSLSRSQTMHSNATPRLTVREQHQQRIGSARSPKETKRSQVSNGVILGKTWQNGLVIKPSSFGTIAQLLSQVSTSRPSNHRSHMVCTDCVRSQKS